MPVNTRLHQLANHGQSVWIDFLSRDLLGGGELARMMREDAATGVTSNPTIFAKALSDGDAYEEQIASSEGDAMSVFLALAMRDVTAACDLLRPIWERTEAVDGYVSIEVDPNLAEDTEATIAQATRFPRGDRAPEPAGQDPGHGRRRAGDRGDDSARLRDQRDPDLFARPPPRSGRSLPARARAARRLWLRCEPRPLGRQLLRLARRHRDRPPPGRNRP